MACRYCSLESVAGNHAQCAAKHMDRLVSGRCARCGVSFADDDLSPWCSECGPDAPYVGYGGGAA